MTSPVGIKEESAKISMTSPVTLKQDNNNFTMSFSMPSNYTPLNLTEPLDKRIILKKIQTKIVAVHMYTWLSSQEKNEKKAKELESWLKNKNDYIFNSNYTYAGYNPPWTIPFLRRNEVQIELKIKE